LPIACFDRLGVPRLSWPQRREPPGADPHGGWSGRRPVRWAGRAYPVSRPGPSAAPRRGAVSLPPAVGGC